MSRPLPFATPPLAPCPRCGHDDASIEAHGPDMERFCCENSYCGFKAPAAPNSYEEQTGETGVLAGLVWNATAAQAAVTAAERRERLRIKLGLEAA